MTIDDFPLIDTSSLDLFVASYAQIQESINPLELLEITSNGLIIEEELIGAIREEAMKLAGMAVLASAQFALGMDDLEEKIEPSMSCADGSTNFVGRLSDVLICDFTDAMHKAKILNNRDKRVLLPGLIFKTTPELECFSPSLGVISLSRYCAVLPSSAYELRKIPFAA